MDSNQTDPKVNHKATSAAESSAGSCVVHPDTGFWPYGDIMEHIDHSFAAAGELSHPTDLMHIGTGYDSEAMDVDITTVLDVADPAAESVAEITSDGANAELELTIDTPGLAIALRNATPNQINYSGQNGQTSQNNITLQLETLLRHRATPTTRIGLQVFDAELVNALVDARATVAFSVAQFEDTATFTDVCVDMNRHESPYDNAES